MVKGRQKPTSIVNVYFFFFLFFFLGGGGGGGAGIPINDPLPITSPIKHRAFLWRTSIFAFLELLK